MKIITIEPDAVAIIANRLFMRLVRDGLEEPPSRGKRAADRHEQVVEALADELHCDIIDRMTGAV